jgi:hypothetical protein
MLIECKHGCYFNSLVKVLLSFFDGNMLNEIQINCNTACMLTSELQQFDTLKMISMFGRNL